MECIFCGSERLRSLGVEEDIEMWRCLECGEVFLDDGDDLAAEARLESEDDEDDLEFDSFLIDNGMMHGPDDDVIDL